MENTQAFVYMLRCAGGQLYTGWTNDPFARLYAHKSGKGGAKATRGMHAQRFAYLEQCQSKSAAMRREAALKKLPKSEKEALCAAWAENARPRITMATREDAEDIMELYNWYVQNHTATFQITLLTMPEYADWVEDTLSRAPLLIARDGQGRLLGYACAHRWHEKEAFGWDVESTIYCAPEARGLGVAERLYPALLELLRLQGYWNVYALLTDPNPASERFHEKLGFACVGREPRTAYKFGRWLGLSTWHYALRKGKGRPEPVRLRLTEEEVAGVLEKYNRE